MIIAEGFEAAFLGVAKRCGQPDLALYSRAIALEVLKKDMPEHEAIEYFDFNVAGAWVGEETPLWLDEMTLEEYSDALEE